MKRCPILDGLVRRFIDNYLLAAFESAIEALENIHKRSAHLIAHSELAARVARDKIVTARRLTTNFNDLHRQLIATPLYFPDFARGERLNASAREAYWILFANNFRVLEIADVERLKLFLALCSRTEALTELAYRCHIAEIDRQLAIVKIFIEGLPCSLEVTTGSADANLVTALKMLGNRQKQVQALLNEADARKFEFPFAIDNFPADGLANCEDSLRCLSQLRFGDWEFIEQSKLRALLLALRLLILRASVDLLQQDEAGEVARKLIDMHHLNVTILEKLRDVFVAGVSICSQQKRLLEYVSSKLCRPVQIS